MATQKSPVLMFFFKYVLIQSNNIALNEIENNATRAIFWKNTVTLLDQPSINFLQYKKLYFLI